MCIFSINLASPMVQQVLTGFNARVMSFIHRQQISRVVVRDLKYRKSSIKHPRRLFIFWSPRGGGRGGGGVNGKGALI